MGERLADGNAALALLGNTLATACSLYVLITIMAPISGAHFNPAVTFVAALRGDIAIPAALAFVFAQIAGAILGTLLAHAMFSLPLVSLGVTARSGVGIALAEFVATFLLIVTIYGMRAARPDAVPAAVAAIIAAGYWFTSSTSFANPAVTLARCLTDTFAGIRPLDVPLFLLVQLAGATAALLIASHLFPAAPHPRS